MEHGGFKPDEILALPPSERTVWQAIAELNREQNSQDMKNAVAEAFAAVLSEIRK